MAFAIGTSYVLENDREFAATLKDAAEIVEDFRIPFGLISRDFYKSEKAIFGLKSPGQYPAFKGSGGSVQASSLGKSRGDTRYRRTVYNVSEGGKSPYQKRKLKKYGFDYPLLVASGRLAASITQPNAPGSVNIITKLSLTIGTTVPYGIYHQSDEPRSKMPLRKFVFIGPEAPRFATSDQMGRLQRWIGYVEDHYYKELGKKFKAEGT